MLLLLFLLSSNVEYLFFNFFKFPKLLYKNGGDSEQLDFALIAQYKSPDFPFNRRHGKGLIKHPDNQSQQ